MVFVNSTYHVSCTRYCYPGTISQEFFDRASGGLTRLEGTHELFAVTVEWERQKVTQRPNRTLGRHRSVESITLHEVYRWTMHELPATTVE